MGADLSAPRLATQADRRRERGFTLLEVVVAVAIAGLALAGLFRAGSEGIFAVDAAARVDEAIERAQSHLAALARAGSIEPVNLEGDDGAGYRWRLSAVPLATQPANVGERTAAAMTLLEIEVTISWRAGDRERSVVLATRRLGMTSAAR